MHWEVWDTASRNLLEDFDSREDGLAWVWEVVRREGIEASFDLALGRHRGSPNDVLRGLELAEHAFADAIERAKTHEHAARSV